MADKGEFRFTSLIPFLVLADTIRLTINTIMDRSNAEEIFNQSLKQCRQQAEECCNLLVEEEEEGDEDVKI
jgi:hypothetical protein